MTGSTRGLDFQSLVENVPDYIVRYDPEGRMLYCNPAVERLTGADVAQWLGKTLLEVAQDIAGAIHLHAAILEVARTRTAVERELKLERVTPGRPLYHQVRLVPELDAQGGLISVLAIGRDYTDVRETAERLQRREQDFRTLAENSPDIIMRFDHEGRYQYVSPGIERPTGWPPEQFIGTIVGEQHLRHRNPSSHHYDNAMRLRSAVFETLASGIPREIEIGAPTPEAGQVFEFRLVPERDSSGAVSGVIGIGRDVTEKKLAELALRRLNATLEDRIASRTLELQEANRELESFAHTISHDLRAPLRTINSFANLLNEGEQQRLSAEGRSMLERIVRAGQRLNHLIDDILAYCRASQRTLARRPVSMESLARDVVAELAPGYPGSTVVVEGLPATLGDPTMLRQVMQNLVANALKFSARAPEPRVEIGTRREGSSTIYYVRDNGVGFDMRHARRLFEMFQRQHSEGEFPGTGVGLAIVKRLVERHGGHIWAESQPGAGATFLFTLGNEVLAETP